jgi:small-conductance mechanosensitive channel
MADEIASPAESAMDYSEHDRTYTGFIALTKIGIINVITIILALAMYAFGGGWGFTLGTLTIILGIISAAIGMASKGSIVMPTAVLGLAFLLFILSVAS